MKTILIAAAAVAATAVLVPVMLLIRVWDDLVIAYDDDAWGDDE